MLRTLVQIYYIVCQVQNGYYRTVQPASSAVAGEYMARPIYIVWNITSGKYIKHDCNHFT